MSQDLSLGFSPCPNDTFMFHALVHGSVAGCADLRFDYQLADIEQLNRQALDPARAPQLSKLSLPALAHCLDRYQVLDAGAALGRGCGPLLVTRRRELDGLASLGGLRVAIPGRYTTAFLLLRIFAPAFEPVEMRFEQVMPAVAAGQADAGLIIHESRFTYREHGLRQLADLGEVWESATDLPLPLGLIAGQRALGGDMLTRVGEGLRSSVELAFAEPARSWDFVRRHAQEMDEAICRQHIRLYVNQFSRELGEEGRAAVLELLARGRDGGHLPAGGSPFA